MRILFIPLLIVLPACNFAALFADSAECEFNRDCDEDEQCDDGECVPDDDDEGREGEGEGEPGDGGEGGEGESDPVAPQFLQFSTNINSVTNTSTVIFSAVLTDPDGVDDIIGGSLVNTSNGASYGSFQTSAAEGSYQMTLTWSAINEVKTIDFATTAQRGFRARFFDVGGHLVEQTINLTLTCNGDPACDGDCGAARCGDGSCTSLEGFPDFDGFGICSNTCRDLISDSDCGSCNASCGNNDCTQDATPTSNIECTCDPGECGAGSVCVDGIVQGDPTMALCETGTPELVVFTPRLSAPFGSVTPICDVNSFEASLFCALNEQIGGTVTEGASIGFGYSIDCTGATELADCAYTQTNNCADVDIGCL